MDAGCKIICQVETLAQAREAAAVGAPIASSRRDALLAAIRASREARWDLCRLWSRSTPRGYTSCSALRSGFGRLPWDYQLLGGRHDRQPSMSSSQIAASFSSPLPCAAQGLASACATQSW